MKKRIKVALWKRNSNWTTASGVVKGSWSWWVRWREPGGVVVDPKTGKEKRKYRDRQKSLKTQDKHEAERLRFELEDRLNSRVGKRGLPARLDWRTAWSLFAQYHAVEIDSSTLMGAEVGWRHFWEWASSPRGLWAPIGYVDEVETARVMDWREYLARELGNKPTTINGKVRTCAALVNYLVKLKFYAGENGFAGIKTLPEEEVSRDWLMGAEVETYMARAAELDEDFYLFAALSLYAGFRAPSECLAARWRWVHWPSKDGGGGYLRIPKTEEGWAVKDRQARTVPLAKPLLDILWPRRGVPAAYIVAPTCTQIVGVRHRWNFHKQVNGLRHLIRGKEITAYSWRHSWATRCLQHGVDAYKVMRWMGHSNLEMLQRYEHLTPRDDSIDLAFPGGLADGRPGPEAEEQANE